MDQPSSAVQEIERIEHELARAWTAGDCDAWSALLAPDWCVTHVTGEVIERPKALQMCREPAVRVASMRYDDLRVRVFGDAAVATGRTTATTAGDSPVTMVLRFTDVFIRRDQRWLVVASHATAVSTS